MKYVLWKFSVRLLAIGWAKKLPTRSSHAAHSRLTEGENQGAAGHHSIKVLPAKQKQLILGLFLFCSLRTWSGRPNSAKIIVVQNIFFKLRSLFFLFFGIIVGLSVGYIFFKKTTAIDPATTLRQSQLSGQQYQLINPLLGCESVSRNQPAEFAPLKSALSDYISARRMNNSADAISVYFDTRDGRSLEINSEEKYSPASLMKVPVMVAVLKQSESDPSFLSKKIYYDGSFDANQGEYYKPAVVLEANKFYTVNDLLERMLQYSDNNAMTLLVKNANVSNIESVYDDLGFSIPTSSAGTADNLSVQEYANVFRFLYNATFLDRDNSEKAMELLVKKDFPEGIQASVPSSTPVAQKFGERTLGTYTDASSQKELHDCGIVYYPGHPFLLCIMTKGKNFDTLSQIIRDISKTTYDFVSSR